MRTDSCLDSYQNKYALNIQNHIYCIYDIKGQTKLLQLKCAMCNIGIKHMP